MKYCILKFNPSTATPSIIILNALSCYTLNLFLLTLLCTINKNLKGETKRSDIKPIKSYTLAWDKNILIIHAEKDEETCKIIDSRKIIKNLKDVVEIVFLA